MQDPTRLIVALGNAAGDSYEPGQYVTDRLPVVDVYSIAHWIDTDFERTLTAGNEVSIEVTFESL